MLGCPWQRCTVHFLREALGHARREQQPMLAALIRPIFNADDGEQARELVGDGARAARASRCRRSRELLERGRGRPARLLRLPGRPLAASCARRTRSSGVNREIGRRTDVVGIFPNDRSLIRLAASVVIEQNDEWLVGRRYLSHDSLAALLERAERATTKRRRSSSPRPEQPTITPTSYTTSWDLTRSRLPRCARSCGRCARWTPRSYVLELIQNELRESSEADRGSSRGRGRLRGSRRGVRSGRAVV